MPDRWYDPAHYEAFIGRWSRQLAPKFVEWAHLPPAARVVDVGCGTGALSQTLIDWGASRVVGVDLSPEFIAHAAATVAPGSGRVRFEVADAMHLPLEEAAFDAAVSGLCLNFVPEPESMIQEMVRVVVKGGHVALFVWDYSGKMEMLRHFWDAAVELNPDQAGPLDEGARFPICHPHVLSQMLEASGLKEVATAHIDQPTGFKDFDDYWAPFLGGHGPAPSYLASLHEKERHKMRELLRTRIPVEPDGRIALIARAWAARGVKG